MAGYGTHNQPPGTWSDDTSLTLCSTESLCHGYNLDDMATRFTQWMLNAHWTPHGEVFDIGGTTQRAIFQLARGINPIDAGPNTQYDNGNGALMRIAPIGLYFAKAPQTEYYMAAATCSRLTHGHIRSQLACSIYCDLIARLIKGNPFAEALAKTQQDAIEQIEQHAPHERDVFTHVLNPNLHKFKLKNISGSGYVIHCLEASLWCCARSDSYENAVLKAVNLGDDTDTTAAVTGALAGLMYGISSIPPQWIDTLARKDEIFKLLDQFAQACQTQWARNTPETCKGLPHDS